jgi:hypothetical protein
MAIPPTTIAGIETVLCIHEERHPGEIAIKAKQPQINAIHRLDADTNKLFSQLGNFRVTTDNLPVKVTASLSPFTTKDHEQRFTILASELLTLFVIVNPANFSTNFDSRNICRLNVHADSSCHCQGDQ